MKILVVNGSPKGDYSITLQTALYLKNRYPEHSFAVLNAGQRIKALEKDFSPALEAIADAELLLFAYPVYTFIAPYQLHRFVELMKEHNAPVSGKCMSQISTSKHFYDVTAHRYVQENAQDMGMRVLRGLSADMDDLLTEKGQQEAELFFEHLVWSVEQGYCEPAPAVRAAFVPQTVETAAGDTAAEKPGDVVVVTDLLPEDKQLAAMIGRFCSVMPRKTRIINLREYPFKGGCLGCFNCATDGKCIYQDGFDTYLREVVQSGEAIVYAFTIRDHSMGAQFKLYDDRQFCNGHRTVTVGMPVGYLVSGAYREESNLQTILEGRAQVGQNPLAGIATDETDPNTAIDQMAATLERMLNTHYHQPKNFLGVGGMKIFRDLIYQMQGMMKADHRFYKQHGEYDFPQKKKGLIMKMYLVGALLSSPTIKAKMGNKMNEGMIGPYRKVVDAAAGKKEQA
ncbi:MAG: NAD(P)H-dependent oxidoreductase [Clostridia bacterium]|nr:NAD(P)H-dependent oxidoreductase [Clostridia bacterium]